MSGLTPEQKLAVDQWNSLGQQISDNAFKSFFDSWFSNARSLIKASESFKLQSVKDFIERIGPLYKTFTVLGSGPSLTEIARSLPSPHGALFCGPTAVGALTREGIIPTAIIVADSSVEQYAHIVESKVLYPYTIDVVLPVTCDPQWYSPETVLGLGHLYFYLPYMSFEGSTDVGYNHILKALFPEIPWQITQAGCVVNAALNVADWCCGNDPDKRIYIGADFSWLKGKAPRAPMRFTREHYSPLLQSFHDFWEKPQVEVAEIPYGDEVVVTELKSLGYAINMCYLIHEWWRDLPGRKTRYALIYEASKLFKAVAPDVNIPNLYAKFTDHTPQFLYEDNWAYKVLLGLVETSNKLHTKLRDDYIQECLRQHSAHPDMALDITSVPLADFVIISKAIREVDPNVKLFYNGNKMEETK
jgi:hypothetical protein